MESMIEEKKQKIKNKIKHFLNENNIPYKEVKDKFSDKLVIEGKIFTANVFPYAEINIHITVDKFLTVEEREDKLTIVYYEAFPKEYRSELILKKANLDLTIVGIYYLYNKLVFLF
jgi:hypothetical protein